jgi:hypothetical protein
VSTIRNGTLLHPDNIPDVMVKPMAAVGSVIYHAQSGYPSPAEGTQGGWNIKAGRMLLNRPANDGQGLRFSWIVSFQI